LLTADDLRVEQEYHRGMRYLHNRLHGHGVAEGLEVTVEQAGVSVSPGLAIDAHGRELVVTALRVVDATAVPALTDGPRDLVLTWAEVPRLTVPGPDGEEQCTGWDEEPQVTLVAPGHAAPEALLLARLARDSDGAISVDTSGRRPLGPAVGGPATSTVTARTRWRTRFGRLLTGATTHRGRPPLA